jgi:hypothetical protein
VEVITFGLFFANVMTSAMLPDTALFACNAMCPIVDILTMNTANRTVKDPFLFFLQLFKLLSTTLDISFELSFRYTRSVGNSIGGFFGKFRELLLFLFKLLCMKDSFHFSVPETLFSSHHTRLMSLDD